MAHSSAVIRDLGDGLVLCQATIADVDRVVLFNTHVHSDQGWDVPDTKLGFWVQDLMSGSHPTVTVGDFLVVEDTATGEIVSSTNLIPQTWSYAGIEFGVGRPELVGTHPDYRRRGLVRAQFEVLHQWSAERGHSVQAITGIPWYYRQFGYDMALDLWFPARLRVQRACAERGAVRALCCSSGRCRGSGNYRRDCLARR